MKYIEMKRALITGITGQDGSYLAQFLILKGYQVHGLVRRLSVDTEYQMKKLGTIADKVIIHYGDLTDYGFVSNILMSYDFDEIYNLGAMSDVAISFRNPVYTLQCNTLAVVNILECLRIRNETGKRTKFYQASTSEMFGGSDNPLNENSKMDPKSPYAVSKHCAHSMIKVYRDSYSLFCVSGILFNHESRRRGSNFVTQKIIQGAINFDEMGYTFKLGNLDARRDWGLSPTYIRAMWLMIQADEPNDYVVATGKSHSVREFCELTFKKLGYKLVWKGNGINEKGYAIDKDGIKLLAIEVSSEFYRPNEVHNLIGDADKIADDLGWVNKKNLEDIIDDMLSI